MLFIASCGVAYGAGGYVVKAWKMGYVVQPSHSQTVTPWEWSHFSEFSTDDAWTALVIWLIFIGLVIAVVFVALLGVKTVSMCISECLNYFICKPFFRCITGRGREKKYHRVKRSGGESQTEYEEEFV